MSSYSSKLFERTIEDALGESIEEIQARPLDPRAEMNAGKFGNPPQLAVGIYNFKTKKYTKNLRDVFPDPEKAYRKAITPKWYERVLEFLYR
jgi:hypothetical protein